VRHADGLVWRIDPDLPVIVLNGRVAEADRVRSFARGADDHVCRPSCRFRAPSMSTDRGTRLAPRLGTRGSLDVRSVPREDTSC
jgi:CheY-like chemotaxis protein